MADQLNKLPKEVVKIIINRKDANGLNNIAMCDNGTGKAKWLYKGLTDDKNIKEYMMLALAQQMNNTVKNEIPKNQDTEYVFIVGDTLIGVSKPNTRKEWHAKKSYKNGSPMTTSMINNIAFIHTKLNKDEGHLTLYTMNDVLPNTQRNYGGRKRYIPIVEKAWSFMDKYIPQRTVVPDEFMEE